MIFREDLKHMTGKPVKFLTSGHVINDGMLKGLSGSGSVIIQCDGGTVFANLKNVFLPWDEIPDDAVIYNYVVAKYMEKMTNLDTLLKFPLQFDIEHDMEARDAYIRCAEKITGMSIKP